MQHDIIFIRNIFRLEIDSADLLASFSLHIPTRSTRTYKLFSEPRARVNTVQSGLFCRLPRVANAFFSRCSRADIFNDTFWSFKRMVTKYVGKRTVKDFVMYELTSDDPFYFLSDVT